MTESVILAGARTPIGKFLGAFSVLSAQDLGGFAIAEALARSTVPPDQIRYVILGQVLQAGQGQLPARQAAIKAGIGMHVPCISVNKVCLSGLCAIALADQLIRAGEVDLVVAGGMESMTTAPYAMPRARRGARMGNAELLDLMIHDGLWCAFDHCHMGESTDVVNARLGIGRAEQDEWAARSHERAAEATKSGRLGEEMVQVPISKSGGGSFVLDRDEGIRPGTTAGMLGR
ncbi:MAG: beta-ketoacyl synthase N-terminal-like domain-containing protein, partial [Actinomycetota bacterium]